jgi:hypothetical protein
MKHDTASLQQASRKGDLGGNDIETEVLESWIGEHKYNGDGG